MAIAGQITYDLFNSTSIATTTDGTTLTTIYTAPAFQAINGGAAITLDIVGNDFANDLIATSKIYVMLKNVDGYPAMVGNPAHLVPFAIGSSDELKTCSVIVNISGTNITVKVLGVPGHTIKWTCARDPSLSVLDPWTSVPVPNDGTVLTWSAANSRWEPNVFSVASVGSFDIQGQVDNALQIISNILYAQSATLEKPGMVNTGEQTFGGNKTFGSIASASVVSVPGAGVINVGTGGTGGITIFGTNGLNCVHGSTLGSEGSHSDNFNAIYGALITDHFNLSANLNLSSGGDGYYVILVDTTSARSITLPSPAAAGRTLIIKDKSGTAATHNITIIRNGSEKIEGTAASYVMNTNFKNIKLISDGADWWIIG
jgi:hypothetical protein